MRLFNQQKSRKAFTLAFITAILLFLGCAAVKELIQPPKVSFESVNLTDLSFNDVTLDFALAIQNPNPIGASLAGYDYTFMVEGNEFLKGDENRPITLPSAGQSTIHIPVTIQFKELYNLLKSTEKQDTVGYRIAGHFRPGGILSGFDIPFSKSGSLPAVKVPKVKLTGLKVKGLSLSKVDLELGVNVDNPNIFGVDMSKLDYQINLAGQQVATGSADNVAQVPKKGSGEIRLPISLSFSGVASALRSAIMGQSVDCAISGGADLNTQFGQLHLPINLNQNVSILR
jgi:LEA14-like dessication related protein